MVKYFISNIFSISSDKYNIGTLVDSTYYTYKGVAKSYQTSIRGSLEESIGEQFEWEWECLKYFTPSGVKAPQSASSEDKLSLK